jgi:hypothetical protein
MRGLNETKRDICRKRVSEHGVKMVAGKEISRG